ncbi:MAG: hypothetical protein RLZZ24_1239, partial [Pseudomonadota bacterium]
MKHYVLVGATSAMAQQCARLWSQGTGVRLTLLGRDMPKLQAVADDLQVRSPQSVITPMLADFVNAKGIDQGVQACFALAPVD